VANVNVLLSNGDSEVWEGVETFLLDDRRGDLMILGTPKSEDDHMISPAPDQVYALVAVVSAGSWMRVDYER
jgi:hypothetical protein